MLAKRSVQIALAMLALAGVVFAFIYPTEERRVRAAAEALVDAANQGPHPLEQALARYAASNVRVSVSELPDPLEGREALVVALRSHAALGSKLHFRAEAIEVTVEGRRARLRADLITTLHPELPELRRPRPTVALFVKHGEQFQLESAEIGAERLDQPEARP
jgi:hypothetical protein